MWRGHVLADVACAIVQVAESALWLPPSIEVTRTWAVQIVHGIGLTTPPPGSDEQNTAPHARVSQDEAEIFEKLSTSQHQNEAQKARIRYPGRAVLVEEDPWSLAAADRGV